MKVKSIASRVDKVIFNRVRKEVQTMVDADNSFSYDPFRVKSPVIKLERF